MFLGIQLQENSPLAKFHKGNELESNNRDEV